MLSNGLSRSWPVPTDNPKLAADLLTGLVALAHPHGPLNSLSSFYLYVAAVGRMCDTLAASGFTGGASQLTLGRLAEYLMGAGSETEACARRMLRSYHDSCTGLPEPVRALVAGRPFNPVRRPDPLAPYNDAQWQALGQACTQAIGASYAEHRRARDHAATGADPAQHGWSLANGAWLLAARGPLVNAEVAEHLALSVDTVRKLQPSVPALKQLLFPHAAVMLPYRLRLAILTGVVPDGLDGLNVQDLPWAGSSVLLMRYRKGRTSTESLTLAKTASRLLQQWLDHTALLRGFAAAAQRDELWLRLTPHGRMPAAVRTGPADWATIRRWTDSVGLTDNRGEPFSVHQPRIRTTALAMRERGGWFGSPRALLDPNHSPSVEGDRYLAVGTPAQQRAVETIIAEAQNDLLRRAQPPIVLSDMDFSAQAGALPEQLRQLTLDSAAIGALLGGQQDVFAAACTDPLSGLHGPVGKPCPARPWVCLLCPLAVFTPRHAANLLRLKGFFSRQSMQLTVAQFMTVFGTYAIRVDEVLRCFDPILLADIAAGLDDSDQQLPLRPEERT